MFAVLEEAVYSFQKYVSAGDPKGMKIFREAEDWILDDRNDQIFCFVSICEQLGINPKYLRQGILRWQQKKVAQQSSERSGGPTQNPVPAKTSTLPLEETREKQEHARAKPEPEVEPDALTLYLDEVASIPRLNQERESELIKQLKRGQERLAEEVLSSPAASRYALALLEKVKKAKPHEAHEVLGSEVEIDPRKFFGRARILRRHAAACDRLLLESRKVSLGRKRREGLDKTLLKTRGNMIRALKNLHLSGASMEKIAGRLKNASALLVELEKSAQGHTAKKRSLILSKIKTVERELELPHEEIKRRARTILESEAEITTARNELVEADLRLVVRIARKYSRLGLPLLDRIQDGNMGLLKAAEKFDPRLGIRFSTHAWWWIRSFVRKGTMDSARIMRVPTHVIEEWRKLNRTRRYLIGKLEREPTLGEISVEMGKPLEDVFRIVGAMQKPISLEALVGEESHLFQFVENRRALQPFEAAAEAELHAQVAKSLAGLPPREGAVLRARFAVGEAHEHTLEEIAKKYTITRERVRQIEQVALRKLRPSA